MRRSDKKQLVIISVLVAAVFSIVCSIFLFELLHPEGEKSENTTSEVAPAHKPLAEQSLAAKALVERIGSQITPLHRARPIKTTSRTSAKNLPDPRLKDFPAKLKAMLENLSSRRADGGSKQHKAVSQSGLPNPMVPPPVPLNSEQKKVVRHLRINGARDLKVRAVQGKGTIRFLSGILLEPAASRAADGKTFEETTAYNFLSSARKLLLIEEPEYELPTASQSTDSLGYTQIHFEHY